MGGGAKGSVKKIEKKKEYLVVILIGITVVKKLVKIVYIYIYVCH